MKIIAADVMTGAKGCKYYDIPLELEEIRYPEEIRVDFPAIEYWSVAENKMVYMDVYQMKYEMRQGLFRFCVRANRSHVAGWEDVVILDIDPKSGHMVIGLPDPEKKAEAEKEKVSRQKTWDALTLEQRQFLVASEQGCYCGSGGVHRCEYVTEDNSFWDEECDSPCRVDQIPEYLTDTPTNNF